MPQEIATLQEQIANANWSVKMIADNHGRSERSIQLRIISEMNQHGYPAEMIARRIGWDVARVHSTIASTDQQQYKKELVKSITSTGGLDGSVGAGVAGAGAGAAANANVLAAVQALQTSVHEIAKGLGEYVTYSVEWMKKIEAHLAGGARSTPGSNM